MLDMEAGFSPPLPSPKHGLLLLGYFWKEVGYEMGLTHFSLYLLFLYLLYILIGHFLISFGHFG